MISKFKMLVKVVTLSTVLALGCGFAAEDNAYVGVGVYVAPAPYYGGVRYYRHYGPYPRYYYGYNHGYRYHYYNGYRYHYYHGYRYHHYYRHW